MYIRMHVPVLSVHLLYGDRRGGTMGGVSAPANQTAFQQTEHAIVYPPAMEATTA